jgi:abortive infection alpha-like protein
MSEIEEGAKAVQEVAKATGKAIDATRQAGGFLARFIQRPLEQAAGIVEDHLRIIRWERQQRLMERANEFMKERGLTAPTKPVPLKIAIPIMLDGSLEENDELQDLWARLLINAADAKSETEVRHAFLSILKDLTPLDAVILTKIYSVSEIEAKDGIRTEGLPDRATLQLETKKELRSDVHLSLSNLLRLQLVSPATVWGGGEAVFTVFQTALGREFMKACSKNG